MAVNHLLLPGLSSTVAIVMVMALANVIVVTLVDWTLLLYMNHISFTTPTSATFYIYASAGPLAVPVFANVVLGSLSTRFGAGRVHAYSSLVVMAGLLVIVLVRNSRPVFLFAYMAYSVSLSFRILRLSILADIVPRKYRTSILGVHQFCTPLGMISSPVIWLYIRRWQGAFGLPTGAIADRFSANYTLCAVIMFASSMLAMSCLTDLSEDIEAVAAEERTAGAEDAIQEHAASLEERVDGLDVGGDDAGSKTFNYGTVERERMGDLEQGDAGIVFVLCSDGSTLRVNLESYKRKRFTFYSLIMLGVRLSTMIYVVSFQPVMINIFQVSELRISQLYLLVAFLSLIPPALVAVLSHVLTDRAIMLIALSMKTAGIVLTMPVGGAVTERRFVAGFVLIAKGSMFFVPAGLSLFTKVVGKMCTAALIGWLWSIASIGPAVVQIAMSDKITEWFGGWAFGVFALPALAVFGVVLSTYGWAMLDQDAEVTRLVVREVAQRETQRCKDES